MLRLVTSKKDIKDAVMKAYISELTKVFNIAIPKSMAKIRAKLPEIWRDTPTYKSLIDNSKDSLAAQFGLKDGKQFAEAVIAAAADTLNVEFYGFALSKGSYLKGKVYITLLPTDLSSVLSIPEANFTSEDGFNIPWLYWLLNKGNSYIIVGYKYIPLTGLGRASWGIMQKTRNNASKGSWRIPPEYAGTINNNWFSRGIAASISKIEAVYTNIISEEINEAISLL